MFRIITTEGTELGIVESVNYIKRSPSSGCFISATRDEAIGVAYKSTPYNLYGHTDIDNAKTVFVREIDAGDTITKLTISNEALLNQLAESDEAAISLYEANMMLEQCNADQDEAIIQIYEMIGELK